MTDFLTVFVAPFFILGVIFVTPFVGLIIWNLLKGNFPEDIKGEDE